jgi:hypothetical protein
MKSCEAHQCSWPQCLDATRGNSNYCDWHKCQNKYCQERIEPESCGSYCDNHTCRWDFGGHACYSQRASESLYCQKHTCAENKCKKAIGKPGWDFCFDDMKVSIDKEELEVRMEELRARRLVVSNLLSNGVSAISADDQRYQNKVLAWIPGVQHQQQDSNPRITEL